MTLSKLDLFYRRLILTKFYTRGWGKPEELKEILKIHRIISDRRSCLEYINTIPPNEKIKFDPPKYERDCTTIDGSFATPVCKMVPNLVPEKCKVAHFQMVLPPLERKSTKEKITSVGEWIKDLNLKPVCIHMAGTGDHGFSRRRELLAKPLLQNRISSIILENPYYGLRKPTEQSNSGLLHVKDLFIMGLCLVLEAQVLLKWLESEGYGPFGLTGISMGGHMASLAATNHPKPIAIIPCMSWTSSSVVWTEGVLSKAIQWRVLESQYSKIPQYETKINEFLKSNTVDSYELGKDYIKDKGSVKISSTKREVDKKLPSSDKNDRERRQQKTLQFMKGVMDQVTDLQNFSMPVDPTLATFVIAKADAYYPIGKLKPMDEVWPGCEVRFLNTGHIGGFLMHQNDFCRAIVDTFVKLIKKYHVQKKIIAGSDHTEKASDVDSNTNCAQLGLLPTDQQEKKDMKKLSYKVGLFKTLKVFTIKS